MNGVRAFIVVSACVVFLAAGRLHPTQAQGPQAIPPRERITVSREVIEAWKRGQINTNDMAATLFAHFKAQQEKDEYVLSLFAEFEKGNLDLSALVARTKETVKKSTQAQGPQAIPPRERITVSREVIEAWKRGQINTNDMAATLFAHFKAQQEKDEYVLSLFAEFEKGNLDLSALVARTKEAISSMRGMLRPRHRDCADFAGGALLGCNLGGASSEQCEQVADALYCICLGGSYSEGGWCAIM